MGVLYIEGTRKKLIITIIVLVAILGITLGFIIKNTYFKDPIDININNASNQTTTNSSNVINNSSNITKTQDSDNNAKADSKYIYTKCKRCGKTFKQIRDGPQYYYCEKCENSPEIQKMIEEEFQ